jgi:predicted HTH transcriptional regulator
MTETESLLQQISSGEDSFLELKEIMLTDNCVTGPHRNGMADEMAAMANSNSGTILLGVNDKTRAITGIPGQALDLVETWVRNIVNDLIKPPLICQIKKVRLDLEAGSRNLIKVSIPRSLFVHQSPGGYLHRIGSSKRQMTPEYLARLFQQRSQARLIRFDEQVVAHAPLEALDESLWQRLRSPLSPPDRLEFLNRLKLVSDDESGVSHPTVSGILMCCRQPEEYLASAFIQAVCYRGTARDASWQLDAREITGPLDHQIFEACRFVERNMKIGARKQPHRVDVPQFAMNAVFEAIVNAVAHRDYSVYGSKIRLHVFSDRLELYSPGTIPNTMTIDSLAERQSARNELLTSLLAKCPVERSNFSLLRSHIMDKRGEGVPIIIAHSLELSGKKPIYRLLDDSELLLTIFAAEP